MRDRTSHESSDSKGLSPVDLILSPAESRSHRYLVLSNRMEVILVHDQHQYKSAIAMDIGVGYFEDPPELAGCAHLCEHMLLLGSRQYPVEDGFRAYLSVHDGIANAYTGFCNTNVSTPAQSCENRGVVRFR